MAPAALPSSISLSALPGSISVARITTPEHKYGRFQQRDACCYRELT
jgi:hypothetical protein